MSWSRRFRRQHAPRALRVSCRGPLPFCAQPAAVRAYAGQAWDAVVAMMRVYGLVA